MEKIKDNKYIIIKYWINPNENGVKIFSDTFANNNKNNFKILFNDKEYDLTNKLFLSDLWRTKDILEIKLIQINTIINISYFFSSCLSLFEIICVHYFPTVKT